MAGITYQDDSAVGTNPIGSNFLLNFEDAEPFDLFYIQSESTQVEYSCNLFDELINAEVVSYVSVIDGVVGDIWTTQVLDIVIDEPRF